MEQEWVTNVFTPAPGENTPDYHKWRAQFVEGAPKATETYTSEELRAMGGVGLYRQGS